MQQKSLHGGRKMSIFSRKRSNKNRCRFRIMANVKIPDQAIAAFKTLACLEQGVFDSLLKAFSNAEPTLTPRQFAAKICKIIPEVDSNAVWEVLIAVIPLFDIKQEEKISAKELAEQIGASLKEQKPKGFPIEKSELVITRLKQLLELSKSLAVVAKETLNKATASNFEDC